VCHETNLPTLGSKLVEELHSACFATPFPVSPGNGGVAPSSVPGCTPIASWRHGVAFAGEVVSGVQFPDMITKRTAAGTDRSEGQLFKVAKTSYSATTFDSLSQANIHFERL
jgi:hypothetical protein